MQWFYLNRALSHDKMENQETNEPRHEKTNILHMRKQRRT